VPFGNRKGEGIASLIGIGGSLTASLLPHHPAYGSRTKAVRSRLSIVVQPGNSKTIKVAAWQGDSKSGTAAYAPGTMGRFGCIPGQPSADSPITQLSVASATPLFPMIAAQAAPNPRVQFLETGSKLTVVKVLPPPNQVCTQFFYHLFDAPTTGTSRDLPDLFLETLLGCLTDKELKPTTAEAEAKKLSLPRPSDRTLGLIYLELQFAG